MTTVDNDGNMTQGYNPDNKVMTMTYDAENRLISAQYTDGGGVLRKTEYSYSGNNMLETIEKYVNGNPVTETNFVRAGFLPLQERDGGNQVTREYTWGLNSGGGIGGLLGMKQGTQNYYYLYDGKGNVSAVIDSSSTVVASYRYDAFGNLISGPAASTLDQPFRFSTKRYDTDTGLYYYGYRYYSPLMGKWITRDPIAEDGGINLYGFVGNSPMNYIDPEGEFAFLPVIFAIASGYEIMQAGEFIHNRYIDARLLNQLDREIKHIIGLLEEIEAPFCEIEKFALLKNRLEELKLLRAQVVVHAGVDIYGQIINSVTKAPYSVKIKQYR